LLLLVICIVLFFQSIYPDELEVLCAEYPNISLEVRLKAAADENAFAHSADASDDDDDDDSDGAVTEEHVRVTLVVDWPVSNALHA